MSADKARSKAAEGPAEAGLRQGAAGLRERCSVVAMRCDAMRCTQRGSRSASASCSQRRTGVRRTHRRSIFILSPFASRSVAVHAKTPINKSWPDRSLASLPVSPRLASLLDSHLSPTQTPLTHASILRVSQAVPASWPVTARDLLNGNAFRIPRYRVRATSLDQLQAGRQSAQQPGQRPGQRAAQAGACSRRRRRSRCRCGRAPSAASAVVARKWRVTVAVAVAFAVAVA